MTTKPKAKKFRVRRGLLHPPSASGQAQEATVPDLDTAADTPDDTPRMRAEDESAVTPDPAPDSDQDSKPDAESDAAPQPDEEETSAPPGEDPEITAIRREGLTSRQLRMARRVAQKQGLNPTSDLEAVRLLRAKGIDPFQRSNMLELVVPQKTSETAATSGSASGLPQTVPADQPNLPSTETLSPAERREREITEIRRDIARRRRRKVALLATRLAFFVMLPTFLAGWYFFQIATPMYATDSEFLIIQNEGSGGTGALGGLLPTQFATSQDAIAVQSYLTSKDAMLRLDRDEGFKSHFSQDWVDPIQRLSDDATNEEAYKTYKKNVKIGFDPTEGVMRMEVVAADPQVSQSFSEALISYAEERVNQLSAQKREDQMRDAIDALQKAETDRRSAQERLVQLQIEGAMLDPEAVIAAFRTQISEINALITQKEIEIATLLNNPRPNQARVDGAQSSLEILRDRRDELEAEMTDMSAGANSLAQLSINVQMAQADLATRDMMLQSALQQMEQARTEANRQVRYLTVAVRPVAPQEASYPRAFENTILAFLIFAGIYLMISLTAAILREQVAS